jgi:hypothetical protein
MDPSLISRGTILDSSTCSYVVKRSLAQGGVGVVWLGQRISDGEHVAIKILHGGRFPITDVAKARFRKEMASSLRLRHQHIVRSFDHGVYFGQDFLVMEYVDGGTIAQRIQRKDYPNSLAFKWCVEIISGLKYLHLNGCVHRDLKPNNILLTQDDTAKLADMGILRDTTEEAYLTLSGDQMGSVLYISRLQRDRPDLASAADDAYSACCCLYEILSRQRIHVFPEHLFDVTNGTIPAYVCDLVMGGIAGFDEETALDQLQECFKISSSGSGELSRLAQADTLNEHVVLLSQRARNAGLVRRKFADNAPLRFVGEIELAEQRSVHVAFLDETRLAVLRCDDEETLQTQVHCIDVGSGGLRKVNDFSVMSPRGMVVVPKQKIVLVGRAGVEIYEFRGSASLTCLYKWKERELGHNFYASDLAEHYEHPLAAIVSHGGSPVIINAEDGGVLSIESIKVLDNMYYPKICFVGSDCIAVSTGSEIVLCRFNLPAKFVEVLQRLPFSSEVLSLAGSQREMVIYVGYVGGLIAIDLNKSDNLWELPPLTSAVYQLKQAPSGSYIAGLVSAIVGMRGRIVIFESSGEALAYLPDQGENDTLRSATHFAWSPSGKRIAVSDIYGYITVFESGH